MAIKTILLRRATNTAVDIASLNSQALNYGEPLYSENDQVVVIGSSNTSVNARDLNRIDIVPKDLSRKEIFLQSGTPDDTNKIITNAVLQDIKNYKIEVGSGTVKSIKVAEGTQRDPDDNGIIDLSADLAGKQDKLTETNKLPASLVDGLATVATTGDYTDLSNKLTAGDGITINNNNISVNVAGLSDSLGDGLDINSETNKLEVKANKVNIGFDDNSAISFLTAFKGSNITTTKIYINTAEPTTNDGQDGDIWFQYSTEE